MFNNYPLVTIILIAVTSYVSWLGFKSRDFFDTYKFHSEAVTLFNEKYRLITSGFLHANVPHLLFNMISLYSFADGIEKIFGIHYILLIYFVSLVCGSLVSLFFHRHHPDYSAIGASGAVSGIIFASIFLLPGGEVYIFLFPVAVPAWVYAILFVAVSLYGIKTQGDNIGHEAHLGGAVAGMLMVFVLSPHSVMGNLPLFLGILAGASLFILLFVYNPLLLTGKVSGSGNPLEGLSEKFQNRKIEKNRKKLKGEVDSILEKANRRSMTETELRRHEEARDILDRLIGKMKEEGPDSLTPDEKEQLTWARNNYRLEEIK